MCSVARCIRSLVGALLLLLCSATTTIERVSAAAFSRSLTAAYARTLPLNINHDAPLSPPRRRTLFLRGGSAEQKKDALVGPVVQFPESNWKQPRRAILLMDCFTPYNGLYFAQQARDVYGVATVMVVSDYMKGFFERTKPEDRHHWEPMALPCTNNVAEWKDRLAKVCCTELDQLELVAVHCESDSGLDQAEQVAMQLPVSCHNGYNEARRNKFLMNQAVAEKGGLQVVQQRLCRTVEEALDFASELFQHQQQRKTPTVNPSASWDNLEEPPTGLLGRGKNTPLNEDETDNSPCCIVKPIRGVATDNVHLCRTLPQVKDTFHLIYGESVFGSHTKHEAVLVQEFAAGTEYAIDIVSRAGEHKVAAVWRYDKRAIHGAAFCYYATELVDPTTSREAQQVCVYAKRALNALDFKWGMTHNEVIVTEGIGPRLVEVNCRQHNMDFAPLTMACIGYNALDMLLAAYFGVDEDDSDERPLLSNMKEPQNRPPQEERLRWDSLPDMPSLHARGAMVHLVNSANGRLEEVRYDLLDDIQSLPSVMNLVVYPEFLEIGALVTPTTDIRSDAGFVHLIHDDPEAFVKDYERIVNWMPQLFHAVPDT